MRLSVDRLQAGMVLAEDVRSIDGKLVLAAGVRLGQEEIARLTRVQLSEVTIADTPSDDRRARALEALEARFAGVQDDVLLGLRELLRARARRS